MLLAHEREGVAGECAAEVLAALAGLLREAGSDMRVLDVLKVWEPLGRWLEVTRGATPGAGMVQAFFMAFLIACCLSRGIQMCHDLLPVA